MPLFQCVVDDFSKPCQTLLQFIDVMNFVNVAYVSMHASVPKEDILAFILTRVHIHRVQKKGATYFFAVTFTNIDGFS